MAGRTQLNCAIVVDAESVSQRERAIVPNDNEAAFVDREASIDRVIGPACGVDLAAGSYVHDAVNQRGVVERKLRPITDEHRAVGHIALTVGNCVDDRAIFDGHDSAVEGPDDATVDATFVDQQRSARLCRKLARI